MEQGLEKTTPQESAFSLGTFEHAQRVALMLSKSDLIPKAYQGRVDNCMIALEMANRSGSSPLIVMQNLHVIQGRPSWSSTYVIAMINACGKFSQQLRFTSSGEGDEFGYEAWTYDKKDGEKLVGPKVTWKMVKEEGWLAKPGSKWKTMPDLMFQYRSASFFGRLHAPELMMGLLSQDEAQDAPPIAPEVITVEELQNLLDQKIAELNKSEFDNAKRIIANKETGSYKKLQSFLNTK